MNIYENMNFKATVLMFLESVRKIVCQYASCLPPQLLTCIQYKADIDKLEQVQQRWSGGWNTQPMRKS